MYRRDLLRSLIAASTLTLAASLVRTQPTGQHEISAQFPPLQSRDLPWHELLGTERFEILFREETEFPGSSPLNDEHRPGTYVCAACYLPLFRSQAKYDSGTGWPSFTQPIEGHIKTRQDFRRIEYHCARCGGHQGHLFDDGPLPRRERWCNNGLALEFVLADQPLPPLRTGIEGV